MKENVLSGSSSPLVSIVVSTYNGEKYLEEQLQSLIEQDYANLEIIVSDDFSSDNTWEILEKWRHNYPDLIRIFRNEANVGWSRNFGNGIAYTKGEYIAWCDQDDRWMSDKISVMVDAFQKYPDATLIYHDAYEFKGQDEIILKKNEQFYWGMFEGSDPVSLFWHCRILGHRMMFPAKLKEYILPPIDFSYDWWIQVLAVSIGRIYYVDKKLVAQRQHGNNATGVKDPNMKDGAMTNRLEHFKSFQRFGEYMERDEKSILDRLTTIMEHHIHGKFDWSLFFFAFRYRYRLFNFLEGGNIITREIFRWRLARSWAKNW